MTSRRERRIVEAQVAGLAEDRFVALDRPQHLERIGCAGPAAVERHDGVAAVLEAAIEVHDRRRVAEGVRGAHAGVVVVADAALQEVARDVEPHAGSQLAVDRLVEVDATTGAARAGVDHDARLLTIVQRREVARVARAARGRKQRFVRRVGTAVQLALPVIVGAVRRAHLARRRFTHRTIHPRQHVVQRRILAVAKGAHELLRTHPLGHVPPRLPGRTLLGGDHHHAVRRARAVNGCRCRRLQHFDVLDVVRIEIGQTVHHLVLIRPHRATRARDRRRARRDAGVRDDHAVHNVQRVTLPEHRRGAADLDLRTATRRAAVVGDAGAGHLAGQVAFKGAGRHPVQFGRIHRGHRRRRDAAISGRGRTRDRHAFQLQHVLLEREVCRILVGSQTNGLTLVAEATRQQADLTLRHANAVFAAFVRAHTHLLADDANRDIGQGGTGPRHGDLAGHVTGLRVGAEGHGGNECHRRQESLQPAHERPPMEGNRTERERPTRHGRTARGMS